jgi:hypothetical protein
MDWSVAHARREAFFKINDGDEFTRSIFNKRRRSSSLAGCRQATFVLERTRHNPGRYRQFLDSQVTEPELRLPYLPDL